MREVEVPGLMLGSVPAGSAARPRLPRPPLAAGPAHIHAPGATWRSLPNRNGACFVRAMRQAAGCSQPTRGFAPQRASGTGAGRRGGGGEGVGNEERLGEGGWARGQEERVVSWWLKELVRRGGCAAACSRAESRSCSSSPSTTAASSMIYRAQAQHASQRCDVDGGYRRHTTREPPLVSDTWQTDGAQRSVLGCGISCGADLLPALRLPVAQLLKLLAQL